VRIIELDATKWKTMFDFYNALLLAIGAPKGHGKSPDALVDSMIWGGMNAVEPPYTIRIVGLSTAPKEVRDGVELAKKALVSGRIYRKRHDTDVEASIEIERQSDDREARVRDAAEAAEIARVQYEGPDPNHRLIANMLRRKLKREPDRER
jgi:hypothetical protein